MERTMSGRLERQPGMAQPSVLWLLARGFAASYFISRSYQFLKTRPWRSRPHGWADCHHAPVSMIARAETRSKADSGLWYPLCQEIRVQELFLLAASVSVFGVTRQ